MVYFFLVDVHGYGHGHDHGYTHARVQIHAHDYGYAHIYVHVHARDHLFSVQRAGCVGAVTSSEFH